MSYPLVIAMNGEAIARINHDKSWSVKWDQALHWAYEPMSYNTTVVIACCKVLMAAKDNFNLTSWEQSESWQDRWKHYEVVVDLDDMPATNGTRAVINNEGDIIAKINEDGSWSVRWDEVLEVARSRNDSWTHTAIIAFCRLLRDGRYNFEVRAWEIAEEDD